MINVQFNNYKDYKSAMPSLTTTKSQINLVPLHTPKSSYGSLTNLDGLLINQQQLNEELHKKQVLTGAPIPVGKEVIFFKNKVINTSSPSIIRNYKQKSESLTNEDDSLNNSFENILNSSEKGKNISAERLILTKNGNNQIDSAINDVKNSINQIMMTEREINRNKMRSSIDEMNLESLINKLLTRKDLGIDYLNDIKIALDGLLDYKLEDICTYQKNILLFKKLKEAYEKYIDDLVRNKDSKNYQIIKENERLKEENNSLTRKNISLQINLDELTKENLRINLLLIKHANKSNSPFRINLNKNKFLKTPEKNSPPITQTNLEEQIENLKQMIINQQNTIDMCRIKEDKMVRCLYIIKNQGLDIEKINIQEVKGIYEMLNLEEYYPSTIENNKKNIWNNKSHRSSVALMGKQMEVIVSVDRDRYPDQEDENEEIVSQNMTKREENSFDTGTSSSNLK